MVHNSTILVRYKSSVSRPGFLLQQSTSIRWFSPTWKSERDFPINCPFLAFEIISEALCGQQSQSRLNQQRWWYFECDLLRSSNPEKQEVEAWHFLSEFLIWSRCVRWSSTSLSSSIFWMLLSSQYMYWMVLFTKKAPPTAECYYRYHHNNEHRASKRTRPDWSMLFTF